MPPTAISRPRSAPSSVRPVPPSPPRSPIPNNGPRTLTLDPMTLPPSEQNPDQADPTPPVPAAAATNGGGASGYASAPPPARAPSRSDPTTHTAGGASGTATAPTVRALSSPSRSPERNKIGKVKRERDLEEYAKTLSGEASEAWELERDPTKRRRAMEDAVKFHLTAGTPKSSRLGRLCTRNMKENLKKELLEADDLKEFAKTLLPSAKEAWDRLSNPAKRWAAMEDAVKQVPTTTLGRYLFDRIIENCPDRAKRKAFKSTLLGPARAAWEKEQDREKQNAAMEDAAKDLPSTNFGRLLKENPPALLADNLEKLLITDDEEDEFVRGRILLREVTSSFESFQPDPNDPKQRNYQRQAMVLTQWYDTNDRYRPAILKLSAVEISRDLFLMESKYRGIIFELAKLNDLLALSAPDRHLTTDDPSRSLTDGRCWPVVREGRSSMYVGLKCDGGQTIYRIQLHLLALLEKVSNARDYVTLAKLTNVEGESGIRKIAGVTSVREAEYETSHLCLRQRGGSSRIVHRYPSVDNPEGNAEVQEGFASNCYNPKHLVAESHQDNMDRQGCQGMMFLNGKPVNLCTHGTLDGKNRCLGSMCMNIPADTQVSSDQLGYIRMDQSRDQHHQQTTANLASKPAASAAHQSVAELNF